MSAQVEELKTLNGRGREILLAGEGVSVTPIKVKHLDLALEKLGALLPVIDAAQGNVGKIVMLGGRNVIELTAIALDKPIDWVRELEVDELMRAVRAVIEVNGDVFIQRVRPELDRIRTAIAQLRGPTSASD